jgi:hypothetical protein
MVGFGDQVETKYEATVGRLLENRYRYGYNLTPDQLYSTIHELTNAEDVEDMNVLYDQKGNLLNILHEGEWRSFLVEAGVKRMIEIIQESYLDAYELFLVRRIEDSRGGLSLVERSRCREYLEGYYGFISSFTLEPYVLDRPDADVRLVPDRQLLEDRDDAEKTYKISDRYHTIYHKIQSNLATGDVNRMKRTVVDIIKRNTKLSVEELNRKLTSLYRMDGQFKTNLVDGLGCGSLVALG